MRITHMRITHLDARLTVRHQPSGRICLHRDLGRMGGGGVGHGWGHRLAACVHKRAQGMWNPGRANAQGTGRQAGGKGSEVLLAPLLPHSPDPSTPAHLYASARTTAMSRSSAPLE
jgi:hypothetical protein